MGVILLIVVVAVAVHGCRGDRGGANGGGSSCCCGGEGEGVLLLETRRTRHKLTIT